jgi:hypothetical protein
MAKTIAYEPHPVSMARKAELQAAGYKILDARFKPPGAVVAQPSPVVEAKAEPIAPAFAPILAKRGRPRKEG